MKEDRFPDFWQPAIDKELATLKENDTGTEVPFSDIPVTASILPTKVGLTTKRHKQTNAILNAKARIVALGNLATSVFRRVFAPTTHEKSLKILLALAMILGLFLSSVDIRGAFLYASLPQDEPVYVRLPKQVCPDGHPIYWKLNKTLYGLRESPRALHVPPPIRAWGCSHGSPR